MKCDHDNFLADVQVNRLTDNDVGPVTAFMCEVKVQCNDCGMKFKFNCPDVGMLADKPCISADGTELRVYVEPSDGSLQGSAKPPQFRVQASSSIPKFGNN